MSSMKKWLDPTYIATLRELAGIFAQSKNIPFCFQGDEATLFSLLMKADTWGIAPDYLIANSYMDNYQRLGHTGNLYRLVLNNNEQVSSLDIVQNGAWDKVVNQFRVTTGQGMERHYSKKWDEAIESDLSVTVTVRFFSSKDDLSRTVVLSEVDPSIRDLDHTWITSPRKRLESLILRELCYNELYEIVNAYDMASIESEVSSYSNLEKKVDSFQEANPSDSVAIVTPEDKQKKEANDASSNQQEKKLINTAIEYQEMAIEAQLQGNSAQLKAVQSQLVEWVKELLGHQNNISDNCINQIQRVYEETKEIVIDGSESLL